VTQDFPLVRISMTSGDGSPEPCLEFPPIIRPESSPATSNRELPAVRLPGDLRLSTVSLASGLALAFEGVRLAARLVRKHSAASKAIAPPAHMTVSYEWMQITIERHEHS
jgi:hypothetical protein